MKKVVLFFVVVLCSVGQSFGQKKKDWEIANTKPIIVLLLDDDDTNSAIYNVNVKKYIEEYFGSERIFKFLHEKEFDKAIKKNKEEYTFIGFHNTRVRPMRSNFDVRFSQFYFGISDKSFMSNMGFLIDHTYNLDDDGKYYKLTEFDVKFAINHFKQVIDYNLNLKEDEPLKKANKITFKEMNPNVSELKELTLLVDKNMFNEKFFKQLKESYKYKYEIVESSKIHDIILSNQNGYAFIYPYFKPMALVTSNTVFSTNMYYIYKSEDYIQLFSYLPKFEDNYWLGKSMKDKMIDVKLKDYFEKLNSIIE